MVFDFEKAKEDREKLKKDRETTKQERRQQIIDSLDKESGNTYVVYLDIEGREDFLKETIKANNAIDAISLILARAKSAGMRIVEKNCRAKDVETGELFSLEGKVD